MLKLKTITLENGHSVTKPVDYSIFIIVIVLICLYVARSVTNFDISVLFVKAPNRVINFINRLFPYNTNYFSKIWYPMAQTLSMSFLGTLLAAILAFPLLYFGSENLNKNKVALFIIKAVLAILRTIPLTVYAVILSIIFGLGSFVGLVALTIFTFSILTKMMTDYIETIDMHPFEALQATGASKFKSYWVALMPSIWGVLISQILYNFEMNVRSSAILGYIGAGGIGLILNYQIGLQNYENVTPILIMILITVLIIEFTSRTLRKRLS